MSESNSHKTHKKKAAGKNGQTEVPISKGRKLDATTKTKAIEVELSGNFDAAAKRLKDSKKKTKIMKVRQPDMEKAAKAMKDNKVKGIVKNLSETKQKRVTPPKKKKKK